MANINQNNEQFSDQQLEQVSGGVDFDQLRRENLDKDAVNFDELRREKLDKDSNNTDQLSHVTLGLAFPHKLKKKPASNLGTRVLF